MTAAGSTAGGAAELDRAIPLVDAVRDAIADGEFAANQRLIEADLSERFGASRGSVRAAPRVLVDLCEVTGAVTRIGVLAGHMVAAMEKRPGERPMSSFRGLSLPAHSSALGKAILAFSPPPTIEKVIKDGCCASTAVEPFRRSLSVTG